MLRLSIFSGPTPEYSSNDTDISHAIVIKVISQSCQLQS